MVPLILILVSVLVLSTNADFVGDKDESCEPYPVVEDFNATFLATEVPEDGLYVPLSGCYDRLVLHRIFTGRDKANENDSVTICERAVWKGEDATHFGYGDKKAEFICLPANDQGTIINCREKPDSFDGVNATSYITMSDNESFFVAARCWGDGKKGWSVFSTKKKLDADVEKKVVSHLRSLGFNMKKAHAIDYDLC